MSIHLLLRELHSRSTDDLVDLTLDPFNETTSGPLEEKRSWLRGVVAAVSLLSMIGAALIVLSYICISSIRTKSREILVHLSVADFGVGCANFIGIIVNFDHRIESCRYHNHASCDDLKHLCTAQAFFAGFSTLASILWTLALSVYIYLLVVHGHWKLHSKIVYFFYVFCWGMPLLISLWLVFTGKSIFSPPYVVGILSMTISFIFMYTWTPYSGASKRALCKQFGWYCSEIIQPRLGRSTFDFISIPGRLGHTPHGGSGWCSLKIEQEERSTAILITILGNDLWVYLTVVVVTVLYLTTHCHIKRNVCVSVSRVVRRVKRRGGGE